jgi:hypothetical protein
MESMETATQSRAPFGKKVRTLAIGVLATTALSIPAVSAVSVVAHSAMDRRAPVRILPDSHRLALTAKPASLRLT